MRERFPSRGAGSAPTTHGPAIFHSSVIEKVKQGFGWTAPKYPLAQLRIALEDPAVLGDGLLKDARTDVLILSFDTSIPGLRYFTRWGQPGAGSTPTTPGETMVEVALATEHLLLASGAGAASRRDDRFDDREATDRTIGMATIATPAR